MAQDCVQSLEGNDSNQPDLYGCRFLDGNGFCYAYGSAQIWCSTAGLGSSYCNDGGKKWALAPLGTAKAQPTAWRPHKNVGIRGGFEDTPYSCSCMKNCSCSKNTKPGKGTCQCVSTDEKETGPASYYNDLKKIYENSNSAGTCHCTCGGVEST
mmetsp:Transcript_20910/g.69822  ORF Transcript_20910/g.69822 Transcript_20910/m.69822 type:complete len:154 (-) Transcript_20910:113-574(-)